jgi:hypothetical protein
MYIESMFGCTHNILVSTCRLSIHQRLLYPSTTPEQSTPTLPYKPSKLAHLMADFRQSSTSGRQRFVPRHRSLELFRREG